MNGRLMVALAGDTELLAEDKAALSHPAVGGVILFSRNFSGSAALRRLTADIRRCAARPLLIAVDHEGGRVQRFRGDGFTHVPPMARIGAADEAPGLAHAAGIVLAAELLAHGIDMTFAPVLDLDYGNSQVIGDRAFSTEAARVAAYSRYLIDGLAAAGMPCCGKHFPGHGFVAADSHHELPIDERSQAELMKADMLPFARFADAGWPLLMTAHIIYSAVDARPVTFSPRWLQTILRGELGYRGWVVSDDLCMQGAGAVGDMAQRLQAAAAAGCDLLLLCQPENNAAALAAMETIGGGGDWRRLKRSDTARITVGDAAYHAARQRLAALAA